MKNVWLDAKFIMDNKCIWSILYMHMYILWTFEAKTIVSYLYLIYVISYVIIEFIYWQLSLFVKYFNSKYHSTEGSIELPKFTVS
jgi:hypothetical protein